MIAGLGLTNFSPTAAAVDANENFNIVTSPLPIKLNTNPGTVVKAELRVKNQGINPEVLKVGLMKFGATGELGQPNLFDITEKDEYAKWVSFSPAQFTAEPNVWNTVTMTIDVPEGASLGYYLAVTFSRASQATSKATTVKGSVATLVLLNVDSANAKRDIKLVEFATDRRLYEYLPANFTVKLRNKGNVYIAPVGNIFITRGDKPVTTITFNEVGGSVLPDSNRVYRLPWDSGFPRFEDRLVNGKPVPDKGSESKKDLKFNFSDSSKLRFGKYTAKLLVVYDDGKRDVPIESTLSFWVIPWKAMAGAILIILVLGYGVWMLVRNVFKKAQGGIRGRRKK